MEATYQAEGAPTRPPVLQYKPTARVSKAASTRYRRREA